MAKAPPHPGLWSDAFERLAERERFVRGILDAISDPTAVIDRQGAVIHVNTAWRRFACANGGSAASGDVGVNFLDVCARSAGAGCADAVAARDGVLAVLSGAMPVFEMEYACHAPDGQRWFLQRVTPLPGFQAAVMVHVDITWRRLAEERVAFLARHDPLTGLLNRSSLDSALRAAIASVEEGATPAVLFIDLDRFKRANDEFGHAVGDAILAEAAKRLRDVVRAHDHVVRAGGDEFVVILSDVADLDRAEVAVHRAATALADPYRIGEVVAHLGASVGMAHPEPGDTPASLMARADAAMYAAKRRRRGKAGRG